ncbi:hypothetical protein GCM10009673_18060 [Nesterenkonia sandarakina]
MVLASIFVPLQMAWFDRSGPLKVSHLFAGILAAALTFWLVSLPATSMEPTWYVILPAAAIAVSALLLPGLSGSFLLLTFGLYEPTLRAAADLDLGARSSAPDHHDRAHRGDGRGAAHAVALAGRSQGTAGPR